MGTLQTEVPAELEMARTKRAFRERLDQFDALLQSNVPLARQALRKLLDGRIHSIPTQYKREHGYQLHWNLRLKPLIDGTYIEWRPYGEAPAGGRYVYDGPGARPALL